MVDIQQIKKLRDETSAPVMDVKRALEQASGDQIKAGKILQEAGFARAAKKADREIKAGRVFSYVHHSGTVGGTVVLGCETDFVARTDEFQKLGGELAMQVASMGSGVTKVSELEQQDYIRDPGKTVKTLVADTVAKTGENIRIQSFARFQI